MLEPIRLPKGNRKVILADTAAAIENRERARSGAKVSKWVPVWHVFEVSDDGKLMALASGLSFRAHRLTPKFNAQGIDGRWLPSKYRDMAITWLETRGDVTVLPTLTTDEEESE